MRIAVLVLALALITCCFVGTTFAKYTSSATGTSAATVAKWSVTANGTDVAKADTFTFNIIDYVNDDAAATTNADDANVVDELLAPGTGGAFAFALVNNSEVTATVTLTLSDADTNNNSIDIPVVYSADGNTWGDIASISKSVELAAGANETVNVYWKWCIDADEDDAPASQTDVNDTALGVLAADAANEEDRPTVTVTAVINAVQKD